MVAQDRRPRADALDMTASQIERLARLLADFRQMLAASEANNARLRAILSPSDID